MYAKLASAVLAAVFFPLMVVAGPNLRVTAVTGPSPVDEAATVTLSWTVTNAGDAPVSGPRSDRLTISRDAVLGDDVFVGAFAINDTIDPGQSRTYSREVVLPQGVFGTAFLAAETDIGNSIVEDVETDNAFIAASGITVTGRIPDLIITSMTAPQNPSAGSVITISRTSRNVGGVRLPRSDWYDRFFLSTDPQYDATGPNADVNIGEQYAVRGALEPSASDAETFTVRLPRDRTGSLYLIVVSDWYNWINEGTAGEQNNVFVLPTPIVISNDRPDLAVTNVALVTSGDVLTGQNDVQITYTVTNQGVVEATDEWYDRLVLARAADGSSPRTLRETRRQNQNLAPGQSYTETVEIDDFPGDGDRVGDVFVVLLADVYDQQPELPATKANNVVASAIRVVPGDLVVSSVTPPATLNAGAEVTFNWQVTNQGLGRINRSDWYDRVFLSTDAVFNTGGANPDTVLGETYYVPGRLTNGQVANNSLTARLPAGAIGQYYIIVVADWYDWVEEGVTGTTGETNNVFVLATPVTIADSRPNLVVDAVSVTPSTIDTGENGVTVSYTIRNAGTAAATGEWYDRTVLSRAANGATSPRTLNETRRQNNNLAPGETYTNSFTVNDFPGDGDRVGDVFAVVITDVYGQLPEATETDNTREQALVVQPGDLVITNVSSTGVLNSGGLVTINWSGQNQGEGRINRSDWYDRVFLSRDTTLNTSGPNADVNLGETYGNFGRLTNGQTWSSSLNTRLPADASGEYYLIVVADWYDWVEEGLTGTTGETNNNGVSSLITVGTDRPNFQVTQLTISDTTLVTGQNDVDITYTITNAGLAPAQGEWYDRVILSRSADGSSPVTLRETRRQNQDLAANGTYTETVQIDDFPGNGDRVGDVFVIVISDVYSQIPESVETDNTRNQAVTLAPGDLQIQSVSIDTNLRPGGPATMTWTTRNIGEGRINRTDWYTRFFVSRDAVFGNADDIQIGEDYNVTSRLAATEEVTSTWAFTIPANLSGQYYVIAVEDWYDWIEEGVTGTTGEINNVFVTATPIMNVVVPGDLEVTSISVPSNVSVGQSIEVFWTVRNNGPGAAEGTWVDEFLLSTDQALGSDISLGAASNPRNLAAGESYTASRTITVPASATGTFFFLVRTDAAGAIFEANENNNFRVNTQTFTAVRADLAVSNLQGPAEGSIGSNLTLNYNGVNNGPGEALGAWADRFVLSTNTVFGDGDDIFLGQLTVSGPQAAANTTPRSVSLEVPANTPSGTYTILMRTDFSNTVPEADEANNSLIGTQVVIGGPDLQVADAIVQNQATLGRALNVLYTQRNTGNRSTQRTWTDQLVISSDNLLGNSDDVVLGSVTNTEPLAANGDRTRTFSGNLPSVLVSGNYFVFVVGDVNNTLAETVEGNNNSLPTAFAVSAPNLAVSGVSLPSAVGLGQSVTVSYVVSNLGDRSAAGRNDRIAISTDQVAGNADDRVLRTDFVAEVAAGNVANIERPVTIPADLTPGTYYITVITDASENVIETSESDNASVSNAATIGGADLAVSAFTAPATADLGVSFNVQATVANSGTLQAPARTDRIIASLNATLGDADDAIVGTRSAAALNAGSQDPSVISVTLPAGLSASTVNLFYVADAAGNVAEINESNNVAGPSAVTVRAVDLAAVSITTDSQITAGTSATAVVTIANSGQLNSPASSVGVYLNTTSGLGGPRVGTAAVPAINAGGSTSVNVTVAIPQDPAASGQRFLIARVDDGLVIAESSEANNTQSTAFTIRPTPQPNLAITQFSPPATVNDGEVFNVTWTTTNSGEANIVGAFAEKLYLSSDSALDGADTLLGTFVRSGGLAGAASFTRTDQAVVPAGLSGSFFLILATDADNQITESNETDNRQSRAVTVNQSQLPDLQVAVLGLSSNRYAGQPLNVVYTVSNAGPGTVNGRIIDRVFFGPDTGGDVLSLEGLTQVAEFNRVEQIRAPFGYGNNVDITLPQAPGAYRVVVVTDVDDRINETINTNNRRAERLTVIVPEYTAQVATNFSIGPSGSQVVLSGFATRTADGQPAGNADVLVQIRVRNTTRSLSVRTQPDGTFSTTFFPVPTEAGLYTTWARHPFAPEGPVQDGFELVGYGLTDGNESLRITPGQTVQGTFTVLNYGDQPITDLSAFVTNPAQGLDVVFEPIGRLEPLASKVIRFSVTATNSSSFSTELAVQVASAAGIAQARTGFIAVQAGPLAPRLESTPNPIIETMTRGTTRTLEVVVRNVGGQPTGALQIAVPASPWLFLSSPASLPALQPNGEARIILTLAPSETLALGRYTGSVAVNAGNASLSIPFQVDAVSSGQGTLTVFATDEFTYFADGAPRVQGATVIVRDAVTNVEVARGTTDDTGQVVFANLTEANYNVEATAPDHGRFGAGVLVQAGRNRSLEAFMPRQLVNYTWTVVPTNIQDSYNINIQATFETNVPAPVVTIEPALIDLDQLPAVSQVNFTIRNRGLILAEDVRIDVGGDGVTIQPLVRDIGDMAANSVVVVPAIITKTRGGGGCLRASLDTVYAAVCGERREYRVPVFFRAGGCGGTGVSGSGSWGGGFPGGGNGFGGSGGGVSSCSPCNAVQPSLAVPGWVEQFFCCLTRNACLRSLIGCTPIPPWLTPVPDFILPDPGAGPVTARGAIGSIGGKAIDAGLGAAFPPYAVATCVCGLARDCVVGCFVPSAGGVPCSAGDVFSSVVGSAAGGRGGDDGEPDDLALAFLKQQRDRMVAVARVYAIIAGAQEWTQVNNPALFTPLWQAFIDAGLQSSPGSYRITPQERAALQALALPQPITPASVDRLVDRWNRTQDYWDAGIVNRNQVPPGQSGDFIALDEFRSAVLESNSAIAELVEGGYTTITQAYDEARDALEAARFSTGQGTCVQVRIQIDQTLTLTRNAFAATLRVENESTTDQIANVQADVIIKDAAGNVVTNLFAVQGPRETGFTGGRNIGTSSEASLEWTLVPSRDAAPSAPTRYFVSGQFSYSVNGTAVNVPLAPTEITVVPNPSLELKYFLQRDVFSDDPFTESVVEPAVPFDLGLIVRNNGAGPANNVNLTSAQPRIIENVRGLPIEFRIIGTELNANPRTPSLSLNFDNIGPGQSSVARFLMTATFQGRFTQYNATFTNNNGLGAPGLSIIDSVDIFSLIKTVKADRQSDDNLPDFMTDETPDPLNFPDRVHISNGAVFPVTPIRTFSVSVDSSAQRAVVSASSAAPSGFTYVRINDPFNAQLNLARVVRSDGKIIVPGFNAWQTSKINRDGSGGVEAGQPERYVHIFDFASTGTYTLEFTSNEPLPPLSPFRLVASHAAAGELALPVRADGATSDSRGGISRILVQFGQPVSAASFNASAIQIFGRDGVSNQLLDLTGTTISTSLQSGGLVGVIDLSQPLPDRARYCINLSGVQREVGGTASENGRAAFVLLRGDVFGDSRVNNSDVGAVLSLLGQSVQPDSPTNLIRSDVNRDGQITQADVDLVLAARRFDMRLTSDACPANITGDDQQSGTDITATNPGVRNSDAYRTSELTSAERALLSNELAATAYAYNGQVVPLTQDASAIMVKVSASQLSSDLLALLRQAVGAGSGIASVDLLPMVDAQGAGLAMVRLNAADQAEAVGAVAVEGATRDTSDVADLAQAAANLSSRTAFALRQAGFTVAPVFVNAANMPMAPSDRILAIVDQTVTDAALSSMLQRAGLQLVARNHLGVQGLVLAQMQQPRTNTHEVLIAANRLLADDRIETAEPEWIFAGTSGNLLKVRSGGSMDAQLRSISQDAASVSVAILADGVATAHQMMQGVSMVNDASLTGQPASRGQLGTMLASNILAAADEVSRLDNRPSSLHLRQMRMMAADARGTLWTSSLRWIQAIEQARASNAKVSLSGFMTATGSDSVSLAYARTRSQGMMHLAASGDDAWLTATMFPGRAPAVMAVGASDVQGVRAAFTTTGSRLAVLHRGVNLAASDLPGKAGLASGDTVVASSSLLAASRVAGLASHAAGDDRLSDSPMMIERAIRLSGVQTSPGMTWSAGQGWGVMSIDQFIASLRNPGDLDGDGQSGPADLSLLMHAATGGAGDERLDLNADGVIDLADVQAWLDLTR